MADPTCQGKYGACKCSQHFGFTEWALLELGKDYGLKPTWQPKPPLRVVTVESPQINRTPAPQPWEPKPSRAA